MFESLINFEMKRVSIPNYQMKCRIVLDIVFVGKRSIGHIRAWTVKTLEGIHSSA